MVRFSVEDIRHEILREQCRMRVRTVKRVFRMVKGTKHDDLKSREDGNAAEDSRRGKMKISTQPDLTVKCATSGVFRCEHGDTSRITEPRSI